MRIRVRWTTQETIEWVADIEVADDFDPDDELHGNSQKLIDMESPDGGEPVSFYREVQRWESVRDFLAREAEEAEAVAEAGEMKGDNGVDARWV